MNTLEAVKTINTCSNSLTVFAAQNLFTLETAISFMQSLSTKLRMLGDPSLRIIENYYAQHQIPPELAVTASRPAGGFVSGEVHGYELKLNFKGKTIFHMNCVEWISDEEKLRIVPTMICYRDLFTPTITLSMWNTMIESILVSGLEKMFEVIPNQQ